MKIVDIRTIPISCAVDPPYASAAGAQSRRAALLVEIETDDGTIGIGEAGAGGGITRPMMPLILRDSLIAGRVHAVVRLRRLNDGNEHAS